MNIEYFVNSLNTILDDILSREKNVLKFINDLNSGIDDFIDENKFSNVYEILYDLAFDLDNYEPNIEWRQEEPSYYGDEKLEILVKEALGKIEKLLDEAKAVGL